MSTPITKVIQLLFFIIVISFSTLTFAQKNITPLPEGVSIYQLDNGLKVMLIVKPSLPMVGINTVVKVGSAYENFATSGMSHMLEHLLFNGTTTMTQKELYDSTDIIGGYNNANTAEYYTNFMMVTPAENILDGMKLQAGMLFDSVVPEEKFEKEKGIVLEEIAKSMGKASEQIERNILSIIYEGHALSLPTLGTYSTIENMNRDDVYNFYKNHYVPNNMIISVIGNFNEFEMLENIKDTYGKIKPGFVEYISNNKLATGFNDFSNPNENKMFHRFHSGDNIQIQTFFEVEQPENLELFDILELILDENSDKIKSDLSKNYGDQIEGVEFSARSFSVRSNIEATLILNSDANLDKIQDTFLQLLHKIEFKISPEIVKTESIKSKTRFLKNIEKPHMFGIYNASLFAEYGIEAILNSYAGTGFAEASKELAAFKLGTNNITIVQHPQNKAESKSESINSNINIFDSDGKHSTLILKQNKGSNLLAIHYLIKNKTKLESKYGNNAAKIWHDAFGKRMESPELQKVSSEYGFTYTVNDNPYIPMDNIYLSPEFGYIRVEGLADDTQASIQFLNDQMLSFIPTQEEFESAKGKSNKPSMMGHGNSAKKSFDSKVNSVLYEEDKYSSEISELTYDNLLEFGKEYFVPSNMIVSAVLPQDEDEGKSYFSSFQKAVSNSDQSLGYIKEFNTINESQKIEMDGGGEQSYLYYGFQKEVDEMDIAALKVLSLLLSDNIVFDIREKQGLAYRMKAGIEIVKNKAMFYINMGTRPENVEKLIPQFEGFFNKKIANEISEASIKRSVNMYLGRMMFRRLSSINQAYYLGYSKYFHNDILYDSKSLEDIKMVKLNDVKQAIEKYLIVENPIEIYVK